MSNIADFIEAVNENWGHKADEPNELFQQFTIQAFESNNKILNFYSKF